MNIIIKAIILFLLLNAYGIAYGGKFEISFDHALHLECQVLDMVQDKDGFFWFATSAGLMRYDGMDVRQIRKGPGSISSDFVTALFDTEHALWILAGSSGLNRYDKETGGFSQYRHDPDDPGSLSDTEVLSVFEDASGTLWVGTQNGGLNRFDRDNGRFVHYRHEPGLPESIGDDHINAIIEDTSGTLWIGTQHGGLNRLDKESGAFTRYVHEKANPSSLSSNVVTKIYEDRSGTIWVGTSDGLNRFDKTEGKFRRYRHQPDNPNSLGHGAIQDIREDKDGVFWIGLIAGGLNRFDSRTGMFIRYMSDKSDPGSLRSNDVKRVYIDRTDILWVACMSGEVEKHDRKRKGFALYRHVPEKSDSLGSNVVLPVYEDREGVIWIGTGTGGLNRFDRENDSFTHYTHEAGDPDSLPHVMVTALVEDKNGEFWMATSNSVESVLSVFDRDRGKCTRHYRHDPDDLSSLPRDAYIHQILQDMNDPGVFWLATTANGLVGFDTESGSFFSLKKDGFNAANVMALHQDGDGTLWIASVGRGLVKFDVHNRLFTYYTNDPGNPDSIGDDHVLIIHADQTGHLWLGTSGGLNRFNRRTEAFERYTIDDGLPDNTIYALFGDDSGNLWMSTNNGIGKFNIETGSCKTYDESDGLQGNAFYYLAHCRTRDGEIWFGGLNGVNRFYPKNIRDNPHVPPIVLTSVKQGGEAMQLDSPPERLTEIILDWRHNYFEFEFAALEYTMPEKNRYAYMLEGLDRDWYYSGARRFGKYTSLPAGVYTLKIRGSNNDGVWNEKGVSVRILVHSPFWKTWWFYSTLTAFGLGLCIFALLYLMKLNSEINVRKQTEHALRESEEKFSKTFLFSPIGMAITTLKDGKLIDFNDGFTAATGYRREESLGTKSVETGFWIRPEDREKTVDKLRKHGKIADHEIEFRKKSGEIRAGSLSLETIGIGGEECIIAALKDITEQKREESRRKKLEKQLRQARKMEAVGTLTGGIAHDFNNILGIIMGNTELALLELESLPKCAQARRDLETVVNASLHAKDIIQQLLSFSRNTEQERQPLKIDAVIKESLKLMRSSLPATIDIRKNISDETHTILADTTQIHQLLINLFTNAAHAMREHGGILNVGLENTMLDDYSAAQYHDLDLGDYVRLTVSDTGHGIEPQIREKIFDPYFTTKKTGEGSGMGLAVVHGIVKTHNGAINVYSEPGKGTVFHILFPAISDGIRPEQKPAETLPTGKEHVLFVDDEAHIADVGKRMLESLGYKVYASSNSTEAFDLFRSVPREFDLVITDMTMPKMTGEKLAAKILEIRDDIPIVVCTGFSGGITKEQLKHMGVRAFVPKPFRQRDLALIVRNVLDN